jgi:hypothetical protein
VLYIPALQKKLYRATRQRVPGHALSPAPLLGEWLKADERDLSVSVAELSGTGERDR